MKVLVAEDDPNTREGIAEVLKAEGYTVEVAADGNSAIEKFNQFEPQFVCLDIMCRFKRQDTDVILMMSANVIIPTFDLVSPNLLWMDVGSRFPCVVVTCVAFPLD